MELNDNNTYNIIGYRNSFLVKRFFVFKNIKLNDRLDFWVDEDS